MFRKETMRFFIMFFLYWILGISTFAAAEDGNQEAFTIYNQGNEFLKQGDPQKALEYYLKALAKAPEEYDLNMAIGTVYFETDRPQQAIDYLEKAAQIKPDQLAPQIASGVSNMVLGRFDKAIRYFQQASRIDPQNPTPYKEMGVAYFRNNDMVRSRENFLKAKELYQQRGDYKSVEDVDAKLKKIDQSG